MAYDTYTDLYVNSSAMILYTMYRSISDVEVSQSPAAATPRAKDVEVCVKREPFHLGGMKMQLPIQSTTRNHPGAKPKKLQRPEGEKCQLRFPANLQRGFLIFSGDGSTTTAGRTVGRQTMGWQGQLSWRYWRILMMLQRTTTTTRRAAMAGWEEGLSPSMPSWEHPLSPPLLASC